MFTVSNILILCILAISLQSTPATVDGNVNENNDTPKTIQTGNLEEGATTTTGSTTTVTESTTNVTTSKASLIGTFYIPYLFLVFTMMQKLGY